MRVYQFRQFPESGIRSARPHIFLQAILLSWLWLIFTRNYIAETSVGLQVDGFSYQQRPRVYIEIPRAVSFHWPQQWREVLFVFKEVSCVILPITNLLAGDEGLEPPTL